MGARWWATSLCAAAGTAALVLIAVAPGAPPAAVWYDGDRFAAPAGSSLDGFTAEQLLFGHCADDRQPRSASGALLPHWGASVFVRKKASVAYRALRKLKLVEPGSGRDEYVYHPATDGAVHRGEDGVLWFRYDLCPEGVVRR
jgi:hypothetical protein